MSTKIITDSACDLPKELIKKYDIKTLPFIIKLNGREYLDGVSIDSKEVMNAIRTGKQPSTSQVPQKLFYQTFEHYASQGINCLYIGFSSKLSGTIQTGKMIAGQLSEKYQNVKIKVIDSLSGSLAQGLLVKEAAVMAQEGLSLQETVTNLEAKIPSIEHIFTINDLNHLYRGGRINLTRAWLGTILNINPILKVENGKIHPIEKQRGSKRVLRRIIKLIEQEGTDLSSQTIGITHADDPKKAHQIKELIQTKFNCNCFIVNQIGSVLSVHLGVGGVGVFYRGNSTK